MTSWSRNLIPFLHRERVATAKRVIRRLDTGFCVLDVGFMCADSVYRSNRLDASSGNVRSAAPQIGHLNSGFASTPIRAQWSPAAAHPTAKQDELHTSPTTMATSDCGVLDGHKLQ